MLYPLMLLFLVVVEVNSKGCPSKEDIAPCTCENFLSTALITCEDLQNVEQLREPLAGIKGQKIYSLEVKNSYLGDVPGYLFKDTSINTLIFSYSKMTSLGDDEDPPFAGLENSLVELKIIEGFWNYDKPLTKPIRLGHLKKLTSLTLENNVINNLGNDWFNNGPESLRDLSITTGLIKEVGDKAFVSLKNLRSFHFTGNSVTLPRSALPATLPHLNSLDLSENEIVEMPSNFFTGFPSLGYIYLDNNALKTIPEETFKNIAHSADMVFLYSNPLVCDSKLKWIFRGKFHEDIFFGECAYPASLNGRELHSLKEEELSP